MITTENVLVNGPAVEPPREAADVPQREVPYPISPAEEAELRAIYLDAIQEYRRELMSEVPSNW